MGSLTRRQQAIYEFIVQQVHARGMPPTLMEIAAAFGLSSAAGIADHLKAIERKGYIRRRRGASRGIEVMSSSGDAPPKACSVPVIGHAPGVTGVQRSGAPRVTLDARWASTEAVAFETATDELSDLGILAGDLLITDGSSAATAGDLIIGRQGKRVAILQVGGDGLSARPIAGRIDLASDVRAYGRVVTVIRAPQQILKQHTQRRLRQRRG